MTKKDIQQRVSQNGKPLALSKFSWDAKTLTFSTVEDDLVLDFKNVSHCTFKTGPSCTFKTGGYCTFKTGTDCTFKTGSDCTFKTGTSCTFDTGPSCTFKTGTSCTFDTSTYCTFDTGTYCTFTTSSSCTFKTGTSCTFKTGSYCTFTTGTSCTFKTGGYCTFDTSADCTFDTSADCTFTTGSHCVVARRDVFEVIQPEEGELIQLCPYKIPGHLVDGMLNDVPHIIADGILSKIIKQKGNVYHVINHGDSKQIYLIKDGDRYAHGSTLKEAKESLVYKIADRDTSKYDGVKKTDKLKINDAIQMYMSITGACSSGTKYFVDRLDIKKKSYTVAELIELTQGQYGHSEFSKFFESK